MVAKHKNPKRTERTAVAPYNFIPLPDHPIVYPDNEKSPLWLDQGIYHSNRYTGWIDVELETKSPIYVRGPLTPDEYEKMEQQENDPDDKTPHLKKLRNKPDFFHTGDPSSPIIPGSSLRGMLRTMCEILGHGKLTPVSDVSLIFRSIVDEAYRNLLVDEDQKNHFTPKVKGGYMHQDKDGRWYIQPAQEIDGVTYARIAHAKIPNYDPQGRQIPDLEPWPNSKNAYKIYVQLGPYKYQQVRGFLNIKYTKVQEAAKSNISGKMRRAVLAISGPMDKKGSEAVIFPPHKDASRIYIPDGSNNTLDLITAYRNQISTEQAGILGRQGVLQENHPVFYRADDAGKLLFFGHTQMFRIPYHHSPQKLLHPVHWDERKIDLAEAMFGKARGQQGGQAGRIFVGDARLLSGQNDPWLPEEPVVIPKILSSPKPTTFQHYLVQSNPDVSKGKELATYNSSPRQTTLRGHKLYWHKGNVCRKIFAENPRVIDEQKDTQRTRMQPVRSGLRFSFRIHFENLLDVELGLLWWGVDLPTDGSYCHKIGMGKSLGLGAIKLIPSLHLIEPEKRYSALFSKEHWQLGKVHSKTTAQVKETILTQFEKFVIVKSGYPREQPLAKAPRVSMLLEMLRWPGPDPEKTRYMEIKHKTESGKHNEYRERPVLPDPLHIE